MCRFITFWVLRVKIRYWQGILNYIRALFSQARTKSMRTQEAHRLWTNFGKRNSKQRFSSFFVWVCAVWVHILGPALFAKEAPNIGVKHISIPASNSQNFRSYDNLKISKFQKKWHFQRSAGGKMTLFFRTWTFCWKFVFVREISSWNWFEIPNRC